MPQELKIAWTHVGPARETSTTEPPPIPSLIDRYVLSYDETLGQAVYLCVPSGKLDAELHGFDGARWSKLTACAGPGVALAGGGYDPIRQGTVIWAWGYGDRLSGLLVTARGATPIAMQGELPTVGETGMFDTKAAFAFDRGRGVWVCLTPQGIWELTSQGVWCKRSDAAGLIPNDWTGDTGVAAYDPVHQRVVFWILTLVTVETRTKTTYESRPTYPSVFLAWDGNALGALKSKALPELVFGLGRPCAQLAGHGRHGLVLHAGAGRVFVPEGDDWKALPGGDPAPPCMESASLVHDPKRDLLILGPGKHQGAGGSERQRTIYVLHGQTWERQGTPVVWSPIAADAQPDCHLAHVAGAWYATGKSTLRAWRWSETGWQPIVRHLGGRAVEVVDGKDEPQQMSMGWRLELAATDQLWAVSQRGATFVLKNDRWHSLTKQSPLFKDRTDFLLTADGGGRLIVWGGEAKGRKLNDTLFFEKGHWRAAKKPSPQPLDFKHGNRDDVWVGVAAVYDSTLGTVVRFGYENVALLEGEIWKTYTPQPYKKLLSPRRAGHFPVHDATTGETLLVDLHGAKILRFDLATCVPIASFAFPPELLAPDDGSPAAKIENSFSYDPTERALFALNLQDQAGVYRLDLGPAFELAKRMGPRKLAKAAPAATTAKTKTKATTPDQLGKLVGVESQALAVGKVSRARPLPASHWGDLPSSVTPATWPRVKGKPMGFLLQLETGTLLRKHAALAVFCALDGRADEAKGSAVVLLRAADLAKRGKAPDGVPTLPARALTLAAAKLEIDEARVRPLAQRDADFAAAVEQLAHGKGMQSPGLCSKRGGVPEFLQNDVPMKGHKFIAQIDFDEIDVSESWPEAELMGCLYIFVREDEKSGVAFWQAT